MVLPPNTTTARRGRLIMNTNLLFLALIALTFTITVFNVAVVHQESSSTTTSTAVETNAVRVPVVGGSSFHDLASHRGLRERETKVHPPPSSSATPTTRQARTFLGIFSRDDEAGAKQRQHYRTIFEDSSWKEDPRVCSLPYFKEQISSAASQGATLRPDDCLLIYTFVVGAYPSSDKGASTEIVVDLLAKSEETPVLVDQIANPFSKDVNRPDVTRLNIRENDNDGKSQTFLYFAYRDVMGNGESHEDPIIEYCMKIGPDTFLSLDQYFDFSQKDLAPAPFHRGVLAGALRDKAYWMPSSDDEDDGDTSNTETKKKPKDPSPKDLPRLESFWGNEFEGVHLYMSGQLYILSYDLVEFVLIEVPYSRMRVAPGGYLIGREGHDVSSMAFQSPTPLQVIAIGKSQRFWKHPLKADDQQWDVLVTQEQQRKTKR